MKELLAVISLLISGAVCEAQGPYAPSGWRPNGPSFDLPEPNTVDPRSRSLQNQDYLPPAEATTPSQDYEPPVVDVSVRGLPAQEQLPIFQLSPVNGQQYVGPTFNADLRNLQQNLRDAQLQAQQDIYREFARQRQLDAAAANANANRANNPVSNPRQFVPRTTTTSRPDELKTTPEATTEALNQGEVAEEDKKGKVTVEVSKQNIQEYQPEFYLASLAQQLQNQNQYAPVQLGQLRAPIFLEPAQKQVLEYTPAQLLAAQQQYLQLQQLVQSQPQVAQPQLVQAQPQPQVQQAYTPYLVPDQQFVAAAQSQQPGNQYQPANQYETVQPVQTFAQPQPQVPQAYNPAYLVPQQQFVPQGQSVQPVNQYQPANQYDSVQTFPQQQVYLQPQQNQLLPQPQNQQTQEQVQTQPGQPQFVYQYQPEYQQPLTQFQYQQPLTSYQSEQLQPQYFVQNPSYQQQTAQQQGQGSLQSGLDVNQQGNGIGQAEDREEDGDNNGSTATAVATAFGARTQPRVYATYGAPAPAPRVQANPGYRTSTETADDTTDVTPVADATRGDRRRPAKLRTRQGRLRPIFTLDKSGHLVLAQEQ